MSYKIVELDPSLKHFEGDINLRMDLYKKKKKELVKRGTKLTDFANAHEYYGIHHVEAAGSTVSGLPPLISCTWRANSTTGTRPAIP